MLAQKIAIIQQNSVTDVELKLIASPYTPQHFNLNLYVKDSGQTNVEVE